MPRIAIGVCPKCGKTLRAQPGGIRPSMTVTCSCKWQGIVTVEPAVVEAAQVQYSAVSAAQEASRQAATSPRISKRSTDAPIPVPAHVRLGCIFALGMITPLLLATLEAISGRKIGLTADFYDFLALPWISREWAFVPFVMLTGAAVFGIFWVGRLVSADWFRRAGRQPRFQKRLWLWLTIPALTIASIIFLFDGRGFWRVEHQQDDIMLIRHANVWVCWLWLASGAALVASLWIPLRAGGNRSISNTEASNATVNATASFATASGESVASASLQNEADGSESPVIAEARKEREEEQGKAALFAGGATLALAALFCYAEAGLFDRFAADEGQAELRLHRSFVWSPQAVPLEGMFAPDVQGETLSWFDMATAEKRELSHPFVAICGGTLKSQAADRSGALSWEPGDACLIKFHRREGMLEVLVQGDLILIANRSGVWRRTSLDPDRWPRVGVDPLALPPDVQAGLAKLASADLMANVPCSPAGGWGSEYIAPPRMDLRSGTYRSGVRTPDHLRSFNPWVERTIYKAGANRTISTTHAAEPFELLRSIVANLPQELAYVHRPSDELFELAKQGKLDGVLPNSARATFGE